MSRWLKSVNNLLENLDGKAEEVAADGQALQLMMGGGGYGSEGDDLSTDNDDYYDDDEEGEEEGEYKDDEQQDEDKQGEEAKPEEGTQSTRRQRLPDTASAVSEISFSTASDDSVPLRNDGQPAMKSRNDYSSHQSSGTEGSREDTAPQAPNRYNSLSEDLKSMATTSQPTDVQSRHEPPPPPPPRKSPSKFDVSPRFPRRTLEDSSDLPTTGASLLDDRKEEGESMASALDPPRQPERHPSLPASSLDHGFQQEQQHLKTLRVPIPDPKASKEYQKLKEKMQAIQAQFNVTTSELKTSQAKVKALTTQTRTLETKLDTATAEIQAQSEELRRAGERMEKDRLRAKEEREDLLDEQEEELEQAHQSHKQELDALRRQYEAQISDLTNQLQTIETKRRQEGGDYTQELQDAIERERVVLKQLNSVTTENALVKSTISKLELQQTALRTKLDTATQSVKTASEREREAEDKLDAAMSLHAKQISQRQSREAELEKTIFDLGTALTLAQQKKTSASRIKDLDATAAESFKDKYVAAAEEVETLKVKLNMETQRREALQEELNEISVERSEELSGAQARQQMYDRKVSEMEMAISRLQAQVMEHKNKVNIVGAVDKDPAILSQELNEARQEIERLSAQLLRHQNMTDNFKSEILALKGRFQAASSRAEQAEKSLQRAQASQLSSSGISSNQLYEMEGGGVVSGLRRRVKGGTARTRHRSIRTALQMNPGRTTHPFIEQVAITLDALDVWMVETGSFLRHEPLARLAFLLYLIILHLWSFALVVFHTAEEPHADFGSLDNNPRHWRAAAAAVQQKAQHN